ALGTLRYSREFEREADDFALAFLRVENVSAQPLYEFFLRMQAPGSRNGTSDIPDFLSTHPSTEERLKRLRQGASRWHSSSITHSPPPPFVSPSQRSCTRAPTAGSGFPAFASTPHAGWTWCCSPGWRFSSPGRRSWSASRSSLARRR